MVEQDAHNLLRIEIHSEGDSRRSSSSAAILGGTADVIYNEPGPGRAPSYLQAQARRQHAGRSATPTTARAGRLARLRPARSSTSAIGPYVGQRRLRPARVRGHVDYFRVVTDRTPPGISPRSPRRRRSDAPHLRNDHVDDRRARDLERRLRGDRAYGSRRRRRRSRPATPSRVTGLACATTYHYPRPLGRRGDNCRHLHRPHVHDGSLHGHGGPDIDVWRGSPQIFGAHRGARRRWVNVLGNVYDPNGVSRSDVPAQRQRPRDAERSSPTAGASRMPATSTIELNSTELLPGPNDVQLTRDRHRRATRPRAPSQVNWPGAGEGRRRRERPGARRRRAPR